MPWRLEFGSSSFFIFIFNQTQSRLVESRENHTKNQHKPSAQPSQLSNRESEREESENQELDENSKSTLECLSFFAFAFLLGPTRDRDAGCRVPRVMGYAL